MHIDLLVVVIVSVELVKLGNRVFCLFVTTSVLFVWTSLKVLDLRVYNTTEQITQNARKDAVFRFVKLCSLVIGFQWRASLSV